MIKQEPIQNSPEMKKPPDIIKSETIEYLPHVSPSKRLKTLSSHSPSASSKGKSKLLKEDDDDYDYLPEQQLGTCGVCLLQEGMSLRGFIDSCQHYFCFVCIMEWAKIESRCPVCKRRFSTIRRPIKDGVFLSERIVNVPVRDQVYDYRGNVTTGPHDPYSQVKCSVCSGSSDDHLLLLCDLCDSAAHSYCVGLGATVPEGDWFCKDCTLSRDEHAKVETNTTFDDEDDNNDNNNLPLIRTNTTFDDADDSSCNNNNNNLPSIPTTEQIACPEVSIHDIVRDSDGERPRRQSIVDRSNAPNARTLQRCLNVHSRIRVLRENWEGLRGGSLNFSSRVENGSNTSQSQSNSINHESTSQNRPYDINRAWKMMDIAARSLGKKAGNKNAVSKDSEFHKNKERLMNEASKVRSNSNCFGGLKKNESQLSSSRKIIASVQVKNDRYNCQNLPTASNAIGSSGQSSSLAADRFLKKAIKATVEKKDNIKNKTQADGNIRQIENAKSEIQSPVKLSLKLLSRDKNCTHETQQLLMNDGYSCQNLATVSNAVGSDGQSSSLAADKRCARMAIGATLEKENVKNKTQFDGNIREIEDTKSEIQTPVKLNLKLLGTDKNCTHENRRFFTNDRDTCHNLSAASNVVGSSGQSSSLAADNCGAQKAIEATLEKENAKNKTQVDDNVREIEDAKSEIQSLVKLNLKLLSRDKKLEVDVFKEVARHATHSIMAACGIEPPKARFRSFERLVCDHSQSRKRPSSTLMPTSCRECFFVFVKDVVATIAVDSTTSCKP